jgi:hypothetical protein
MLDSADTAAVHHLGVVPAAAQGEVFELVDPQ